MENHLSDFDSDIREDGCDVEYWAARVSMAMPVVDAGYRGLYGGLTEDDIHALKRLEPEEEISNWMGSEELADNIFRAAQTDAAMKRNNVQGKERANMTHFQIGRKVREFIINELEGTPPEQLPTPEKSIRQLEQEEQFRLKHRGQMNLFETRSDEVK